MKNRILLFIVFSSLVFVTCYDNEPQSETNSDPSVTYKVYEGNYGEIGAAGGEITITDTSTGVCNASVIIPSGAMATTERIRINSGDDMYINGTKLKVVRIEPSGLQFLKSVKIGIPISEGVNTNIRVYHFDGRKYIFTELELAEIDQLNNIAYALTNHFSSFFAIDGEINPSEFFGTFTDARDSFEYNWVKIGEQIWMKENLAYLPAVSPPTVSSLTEPNYYVYDFDGTSVSLAKETDNYKTYGVLYNWPAAMAGDDESDDNPSGVRGVSPVGWHIPSRIEWNQLIEFGGGKYPFSLKAKEVGTKHWYLDFGCTNETGFTALPGGYYSYRDNTGAFEMMRDFGLWYSSTMTEDKKRIYGLSINSGGGSELIGESQNFGMSIRCVKD